MQLITHPTLEELESSLGEQLRRLRLNKNQDQKTLAARAGVSVRALLSDALPDDIGHALINRYMAGRGVVAADVTPLDRLAYMGTRAAGALVFKPARQGRDRVEPGHRRNPLRPVGSPATTAAPTS